MLGPFIRVGGQRIDLSHLDLQMFPGDGITKEDIIVYYRTVARVMLRHVKDRPLTLQRSPKGIEGETLCESHRPDDFPDWIPGVPASDKNGGATYITVETPADFVYLANLGVTTLYMGLSRVDRIDYPDRMVFDLEPGTADFSQVQKAARRLNQLLQSLGLAGYVQTTGLKGMQVLAPIKRTLPFDAVGEVAAAIASRLESSFPKLVTTDTDPEQWNGRVFIGHSRNAIGNTVVVPYSLRTRAGAPVATPLDWREVSATNLQADKYTLRNIRRRLSQKPDPWDNMNRRASSLMKAQERLAKV